MKFEGRVKPNVERLKQLRRSYGISQEELADLCLARTLRVSVSSIKRAEAGKNLLFRTIRDLAQFYGVPIDELIASPYQITNQENPVNENADLIWFLILEAGSQSQQGELLNQLTRQKIKYQHYGGFLLCFPDRHLPDSHLPDTAAYYVSTFINQFPQTEKFLLIALPDHYDDEDVPIAILNKVSACRDYLRDCFAALRPGEVAASRFFALSGYMRPVRLLPTLPVAHRLELSQPMWQLAVDAEKEAHRQFPPTVRELEYQQLLLMLSQVIESSRGYVCRISGVAGSGKTCLLNAVLGYAARRSVTIRYIQLCPALSNLGCSYIKLFKMLIGGEGPLNAVQLKSAVAQLELTHQQYVAAKYLAGLPRKDIEQQQLDQMGNAERQQLFIQVIEKQIYQLFSHKPAVLAVDNVHLIDDVMLSLLQTVVAQIESFPLLLLLTNRPEGQYCIAPDWLSRVQTLELQPLSALELSGMVVESEQLSPQQITKAATEAHGHPLYFRQRIYQLLFSDAADDELRADSIPLATEYMLSQYLGRLPASYKEAMQLIVAFGHSVTLEQLRFATRNPQFSPDLLIENGLLRQTFNAYTITHPLFSILIYRSLPETNRIKLHQICESWHQEQGEVLEQIFHLMHFDKRRAIDILINEANRLAEQHGHQRALSLVEQVEDHDLHDVSSDLLFLKGSLLMNLGRMDESSHAFYQAIVNAGADGVPLAWWSGLFSANLFQTPVADVVHSFRQFFAQAGSDANNHYERALTVAEFQLNQGKISPATQLNQIALNFADQTDDQRIKQRAFLGLAACAFARGELQSSDEFYTRYQKYHPELPFGDVPAQNMFYLLLLESVNLFLFKLNSGLMRARTLLMEAESRNNIPAQLCGRLLNAWYLIEKKKTRSALVHIEQGKKLAKGMASDLMYVWLLEAEARCHLHIDNRQADDLLTEALSLVNKSGLWHHIGPWLCGIKALVSQDAEQQRRYLLKGEEWLQSYTCLSHNYLRFYQYAIAVAWQNRDIRLLQRYSEKLRSYTNNEPVPWSVFHLKQADAYILMIESESLINELPTMDTDGDCDCINLVISG